MKVTRDELVAGGVAVAAFACSAAHIYSVAEAYGNHWTIAALHPLGLDGLIYVGLRNLRRAPAAGWVATAYGAIMSLVFNAASYADVQLWWPIMAAAMPLAMVLGFLVIHAGHRDKPAKDTPPVVPARSARPRAVGVPMSEDKPAPVAAVTSEVSRPGVPAIEGRTRRGPKDWDRDKALALLAEGRPRKEIAELCGVSRKSIDRLAERA